MRSLVLATAFTAIITTSSIAGGMPEDDLHPVEPTSLEQTIDAPNENNPLDAMVQFFFTALFLIL
jgi:hypothetical protein